MRGEYYIREVIALERVVTSMMFEDFCSGLQFLGAPKLKSQSLE